MFWIASFHSAASESPNENKISYVRSRRATCTVCGKVVAEAGSVTTEHVSCIAWLGRMVVLEQCRIEGK